MANSYNMLKSVVVVHSNGYIESALGNFKFDRYKDADANDIVTALRVWGYYVISTHTSFNIQSSENVDTVDLFHPNKRAGFLLTMAEGAHMNVGSVVEVNNTQNMRDIAKALAPEHTLIIKEKVK